MTALGAILSLSAALAGPFSAKTMQGEFPLRQSDRELVLPKGWLQIGLSAEHKSSQHYRDANGVLTERAGDTVWLYRQSWLRIEQGFSPRLTRYAHIPFVQSTLRNGSGLDLTTQALGDVQSGIRFQPLLQTRHKLAFSLNLKSPSGVEWPSDYIGGASNTSSFLTGTGTTNLGLDVHTRARVSDDFLIDLRTGYVHKFPAIVGYVLETDRFGNGWLNPGDELYVQTSMLVQVGDQITVQGDLQHSTREAHRLGVSGPSTSQVELETLSGTQATYTHAGGSLTYSPKQQVEFRAGAMNQVRGTDTRIFAHLGLEEFSPQPGVRYQLEVMLRW